MEYCTDYSDRQLRSLVARYWRYRTPKHMMEFVQHGTLVHVALLCSLQGIERWVIAEDDEEVKQL